MSRENWCKYTMKNRITFSDYVNFILNFFIIKSPGRNQLYEIKPDLKRSEISLPPKSFNFVKNSKDGHP